MSQLSEIIGKINQLEVSNPRGTQYALRVVDLATDMVLAKNKYATNIVAEYQTIENYLNQLHDKGHTNLEIQLVKKNGNNFAKVGTPVVLAPKADVLADVPNNAEPQKKKKKKKNKDFAGLGLGLNAMDIMGLKSKSDRLESTLEELKEVKADNRELKAKNETLKEQLLEKKYSTDNADSKNVMITEGIKAAPAVLPMLLAAIKEAANPNAGLSKPAVPEVEYTEVQQIMVNNLSFIDDSITEVLNLIAQKIAMPKPGDTFTDELMQLIAQHKLKVV